MTTKESYRERQENELEALQSIFCGAVEDLRPPAKDNEKWYPLDIRVTLYPTQNQTNHCQVTLRILCPRNYPKSPPKLSLENPKNLSDTVIATLLNKLNKEAYDLKGEVMTFELCTLVETFLREYNQPPVGSFYDQMQKEKEKKEQFEMNQKNQKEIQQRQAMQDEMLKRKEQLKKERKIRRTMSESSPLHLSTTSQEMESGNRSFSFVHESCEEHRKSETLYFPTVARKIQLGACLGHSQKGCVTYSGIDLQSGQLCFITEWNVKYCNLEAQGKQVDSVIDTLEKDIAHLSSLRHKHLISYECIACIKKKDCLLIYLVQDFVLGTSIFNISASLGWSPEGASMVAKGVLEALIFLHNNGVSHGNLLDSTVLMDRNGTIKVTDFSLVPYLQEICCNESNISSDLPALGTLIESLIPTPYLEMRDFIDKCKSVRVLATSDLQDHPFLIFLPKIDHSKTPDQKSFQLQPFERPQSFINLPVASHSNPLLSDSRLQTEFEIMEFIGKGAYGDVISVRNKLDNREYAIKKIPITKNTKHLEKKMTREVELLSRLNHENVVRYFNSWIEITLVDPKSLKENEESESDNKWSMSRKNQRNNQIKSNIEESSSDESSDWINFAAPNINDNSEESDGIEFVDSRGNVVKFDEQDESEISERPKWNGENKSTDKVPIKIVYIQMELCNKQTLRQAIDEFLCQDKDRVWKLFREICEGLAHIHQQGIIHRDLKPVNVFLDTKDHVKIGDFGLATTNWANQHEKEQKSISYGESTGLVGTALYVAPELSGAACKAIYSNRVDLYSLGIILFEMCNRPFGTQAERVKTLMAIRQPNIQLPVEFTRDERHEKEVQLLHWLLDHNPNNRPSSEELLQSNLVPATKMEANEMQEMLRHVLANPQSRGYKHLISRCLAQDSSIVDELTYHMGLIPISPVFENVKNKIVGVLRKHGAIDITTPLLTPYSKKDTSDSAVRLMTHSGSVVTLPYDLRKPFLRHVALNGINFMRRYSIGRVYREKKMFNFHPKQILECAFDIVTPNRGNFLVDAEILAIAQEIVNEFVVLKERNLTFRINHTSLLRSVFLYSSIPPEKYKKMLTLINDLQDNKISKFQFNQSVNTLLPSSKNNVNNLLEMIQLDTTFEQLQTSVIRPLIKGRGEASSLAKGAIRELETVVSLAQLMGVTIPMTICVGLSMGHFDCSKPGGIVWQLRGELKAEKHNKTTLFACGGRYDNLIDDYQKAANSKGLTIVNREMYSAGFSFAMDKLVFALTQSDDHNSQAIVDILVFVSGTRPPLKEVASILRALWHTGVRCSLVEAQNFDEELAKELGARHIVLLGEGGVLRVKTWQSGRFCEKPVTKPEIIDYIKKNLIQNPEAAIEPIYNITRNNSITTISNKNQTQTVQSVGTAQMETIIILSIEKLTVNKRKRLENQVEQKLSGVLGKFSKKEHLTMFAVELTSAEIKALISCIDPIPIEQADGDSVSELDPIMERFPKKKRYIQEVYDEIIDKIGENKPNSIVGLFSINESYYRLIL